MIFVLYRFLHEMYFSLRRVLLLSDFCEKSDNLPTPSIPDSRLEIKSKGTAHLIVQFLPTKQNHLHYMCHEVMIEKVDFSARISYTLIRMI